MSANRAAARWLTSACRSARSVTSGMVELLRNFRGIDQYAGRRDPSWWSGYPDHQSFGAGRNSGRDMAISLGFGPVDLARCRFAYSPVFETLPAVPAATGPD